MHRLSVWDEMTVSGGWLTNYREGRGIGGGLNTQGFEKSVDKKRCFFHPNIIKLIIIIAMSTTTIGALFLVSSSTSSGRSIHSKVVVRHTYGSGYYYYLLLSRN